MGDCTIITMRYICNWINKIKRFKKNIMLTYRNSRLNEKVGIVTKVFTDFSATTHLDNSAENIYYGYLIFNAPNEFLLGNRKFKFEFNNYPGSEISILKIFIVKSSSETLSGFRDFEIPVDFRVNIGGAMILNGQQHPEHTLGISLFGIIHEYVMTHH